MKKMLLVVIFSAAILIGYLGLGYSLTFTESGDDGGTTGGPKVVRPVSDSE